MCNPTTAAPAASAATTATTAAAAAAAKSDKPSSTTSAAAGSSSSATSTSSIASWWMAKVAERQAQIDRLNDRVEQITKKAIEKQALQAKNAIANNTPVEPLAPEFVHAQMKMTTITAGAPVYQLRCAPLVYVYTAIAVALVLFGASQLHPVVTLLCLVTMFLGYDVYSGVLHVVFDHPSNIMLPVLGQPCLEFQWHHSIPDDIVRKDFVDVCGDLNVVIGLLIVLNVLLLPLDSGIALLLGGTKLLMAYFGQFSHKSAHGMGKSLPGMAKWLQTHGFMVSTKAHLSHHQPPYNVDYCLVGPGNALIDFMRTLSHSNSIWLSVFLVWSVLDIWVLTYAVEFVTKSMGLFER